MSRAPAVMMTVLRADGTSEEIVQRHRPSLEQLQGLVGGLIERVTLDDRRILIVDQEAVLKGKPTNPWSAMLDVVTGWAGDAVLMLDEDFDDLDEDYRE